MILLSDHAIKKADCGQSLIGGLDVHVCRNYFGSQVLHDYVVSLV
jgi:glutamine amidotransferase PdxT